MLSKNKGKGKEDFSMPVGKEPTDNEKGNLIENVEPMNDEEQLIGMKKRL